MRSVVLRSLAVIGAGGIVLAGVLYVASTIDARPPEVLEIHVTQPLADDARRALITTSLEVVFSEAVDPDSAAAAFSVEPSVEGALSWSGSTMIFTPGDPLDLETAYRVEIGPGVRDLSGNEIAELPPPFEFETAGRPSLVEATPADGATDVPLEAPIALTFSGLMDTASVEAELRLRPAFPHELRWSGELLEIVPSEPLRPGQEYEVSVRADAADVAGVALGEPITVTFRTVAPGLAIDTLVPADGIDGIAPTSPIAIIFDRPVDPTSVSDDLLSITPEVAGTLEVVSLPGADGAGAGSVLRFSPSGPLPANTTFDVELTNTMTSMTGGTLAAPASWTFTTGAPVTTISNQITFITDRAGIPNVWAMNSDGTAKRQLSAELVPVLDYAVAPDGSSLVLADGRRLVYQRPDGSDRRVLTEEGLLEFDPAYSPNGQRVAFARADAATGAGLGLWEWEIGAADAAAVTLASEGGPGASPTDSAGGEALALRAPRYSPDGEALAFVDLTGAVGVLELDEPEVTRVDFAAAGAPVWLPDSATLLINGAPVEDAAPEPIMTAPVAPLAAGDGDDAYRLLRSRPSITQTPFGSGSRVVAIASDGAIAYVDQRGSLWLADLADAAARDPTITGERVIAAAFAPGEPAMVIVVGPGRMYGTVELVDLDNGRRTELAPDGSSPRWLP